MIRIYFKKYIYDKKLIQLTIEKELLDNIDQHEKLTDLIKILCILKVDPPKDIILEQLFEKFSGMEDLDPIQEFTIEGGDNPSHHFSNSVIADDDTEHIKNVQFYKNEIKSEPEGDFIDVIHEKWFGKWELLERHHSYIQWLFPIRHGGLNSHAQPMSKYETSIFKENPKMIERVIKSYEMMLDFFGMILKDKEKGIIERNNENWEKRYYFLSRSSHNYLRITRILKCFGILGLENFKLNFILFMIQEVFENKQLLETADSLINYWIPTIIKESDLQKIEYKILEITKTRISRKWYKEDPTSWANLKIYDAEEKDWEKEDIPLLQIPQVETKYHQAFYSRTFTPLNYSYKKVEEKLPDEEVEIGSLF